MMLQRYVIIVATAFGGAWTMIVGGLAVAGDRGAARAAAAGDVWILYPTDAGARTALGAARLDRARAGRHGRAARHHGRKRSESKSAVGSAVSESDNLNLTNLNLQFRRRRDGDVRTARRTWTGKVR